MQLFYNPNLDDNTQVFFFSVEESKHIIRVLRKKQGDVLHITNGIGYRFVAKILDENPKKCRAQILSKEKMLPSPYHLHIAIAPTKMNDRFEWFLEKATEIGIHEITPILCEYSERSVIKLERFKKVIQSALKQSLQYYLPKLNDVTLLEDFLNTSNAELTFIAHCHEGKKPALRERVIAHKNTVVLIGPEGDFSKDEINLAENHGFEPVSLGKSRLRTETAGLVACATVASINN